MHPNTAEKNLEKPGNYKAFCASANAKKKRKAIAKRFALHANAIKGIHVKYRSTFWGADFFDLSDQNHELEEYFPLSTSLAMVC